MTDSATSLTVALGQPPWPGRLGEDHHGDEAEHGRRGSRREPIHHGIPGQFGAGMRRVWAHDGLHAGGGDERCRVLGMPFRPRAAHIVPFGMVRVTKASHLYSLIQKRP